MCLHPYVSKGSATFRLYADPAADVDFALTGEINAAATKLFTIRIGAHELEFLSHQQVFLLEEWARAQDREVVLSTNRAAIVRLVDVLGLTHVRTDAKHV